MSDVKPSAAARRDAEKSASVVPDKPKFRSAYSERVRLRTVNLEPSMTKQAHKDECDINVIMSRYQQTGVLPGDDRIAGARYMDCTGADYQEAMMVVASAKTAFLEMPAGIRDRFDNDPRRLMEFLEDPRNLEEARELGLVNPEAPAATPLAVRVVESVQGDPSQSLTRIEAGEAAVPAPTRAPAPKS